jgi:RNA polymerase sigma-70 factor (ECF subfamily)
MGSRSELEQVLKQAQGGDHQAFARLVDPIRERLEPVVFLLLGKPLRRRVDTEDVIQETFLRVHRSLGSFAPEGDDSFFQWVVAIARNVIHDFGRQHRAARKGGLDVEVSLPERDVESPSVSPSRGLRREERFARLEDALEKLSPEHREAIFLSHVQGLETSEVGRRMDRSRPAAAMLILRALRELKSHFGTTESFHLPDRPLGLGMEPSHE